MSTTEQLKKELAEFKISQAIKKACHAVAAEDIAKTFPEVERSYTYRKSPAIKVADLAAL